MFNSVDGQPIEFEPYGRIENVKQAGEVYGDACARLWADSASTAPEFRDGIIQLREALAAHFGIAESEIFKTLGTTEHVMEIEDKYREHGFDCSGVIDGFGGVRSDADPGL